MMTLPPPPQAVVLLLVVVVVVVFLFSLSISPGRAVTAEADDAPMNRMNRMMVNNSSSSSSSSSSSDNAYQLFSLTREEATLRRLSSSSSTSSSTKQSPPFTTSSFTTGGTQYLGLNFADNNGAIAVPPDSMGAVSKTTMLSATSWLVEVRNKNTGRVLYKSSFSKFFAATSPNSGSLLYDPKVLYDEYEDRLCILVLERRGATGPGLYSENDQRRNRQLMREYEQQQHFKQQQQQEKRRATTITTTTSRGRRIRQRQTKAPGTKKQNNTTKTTTATTTTTTNKKPTKFPKPLATTQTTTTSSSNTNATADQVSRILLAISKNGSPTGPQDFYFQAITSLEYNPNQKSNFWADFPGFEAGPDALYICATVFTFNNNEASNRLWIVHKTPLYQGGTVVYTRHSPYASSGIIPTCTPAYVHGGQIIATTPPLNNNNNNNNNVLIGTYLVSYEGSYTSKGALFVIVVAVIDPLGTPQFQQFNIPIGNNVDATQVQLLDAPQLGGTLTSALIFTNDRRALDACWRNHQLWMTFTIMPQQGPNVNQTTAYWVNINTDTMTVRDQGEIGGEDIAPNTFTFFPSVAVNKAGVAAFGFSASGLNIRPGAYMVGRAPSDPQGMVTPSLVVKAGVDFYNRTSNRWGDFSAAVVDPSDDSFWIYNEYADKRTTTQPGLTGVWGTAWRNFRSLATPSPTMVPTTMPPTLLPTVPPTLQPTIATPPPTNSPSLLPTTPFPTMPPSPSPMTLSPSQVVVVLPPPRSTPGGPTMKPSRRKRVVPTQTPPATKSPTRLPTSRAPNTNNNMFSPTFTPSQSPTVRPTGKQPRRRRVPISNKPPSKHPTISPSVVTITMAPSTGGARPITTITTTVSPTTLAPVQPTSSPSTPVPPSLIVVVGHQPTFKPILVRRRRPR